MKDWQRWAIAILTGFFLAWADYALAQKECVPISATQQNCTVTLTVALPPVDATHPAATSIQIRRRDGSGSMAVIGTLTPPILSMQNVFTDTGNVFHAYDAIALSAGGKSSPSAEASWTTPALAPQVPNIPGPPQISKIKRDSMTISWKDTSNNEDGFAVLRMQGSTVNVIGTTQPNVVTLTDTGLRPSTVYHYQVAAFNEQGYSAPSKQVTARTKR